MKFLIELLESIFHELVDLATEDALTHRIKDWLLVAFWIAALVWIYSGFFVVEDRAGEKWAALAIPLMGVALTFLLWFLLMNLYVRKLPNILDNDLAMSYVFCALLYVILFGPYLLALVLVERDLAMVGRFSLVSASLFVIVPTLFLAVQISTLLPGFVQAALWIIVLVLLYLASEHLPRDLLGLKDLIEKYQAVGLRSG